MNYRAMVRAVALLAAMSMTSTASATSFTRSFNDGLVDIMTVFEFGDTIQPVFIDQTDPINIARVFEFSGSGTAQSTIIQSGTRNIADVFQVGTTTSSVISQSGPSNIADVTQIGNVTNSLIAQFDMNAGSVSQFGPAGTAERPNGPTYPR